MKYIRYEIKKLLGAKYLLVFLVLLLCANGVVAYVEARRAVPEDISVKVIESFYRDYFDDPEQMQDYYREMEAFNRAQIELSKQAAANGDTSFEVQMWENRYAPEGMSDMLLFKMVEGSVKQADSYSAEMDKIIYRAKINLIELESVGESSDGYPYKYQQRIIEIYEALRDNVVIKAEYSHGWNEYFAYDTVNIFIFAVLIMIGSVVFAQEKSSGVLPIIRTCRGGRASVAVSKLVTMGIITVLVVLLFTLTSFFVFGAVLGYSSHENALQSLTEFKFSQYIVSIGEYFAITIGVRLLTFLTFSALLLLLSVFVYNYTIIYAGGLGFFGLNFLFYTLQYANPNNPLKSLNFVATAAVDPLFGRFRSVNWFGEVWGYVGFMLTVFGVIIAVCCALIVLVFEKRRSNGVDLVVIGRLVRRLRTFFSNIKLTLPGRKRAQGRSRSLYGYELHKTLIASKMILLVFALLLVKTYFFSAQNISDNNYFDEVYKGYATQLEGELDDQKLQYIAEERANINEAKNKYEQMSVLFAKKEIDYETYRDYLKSYNYATSHDEPLAAIEQHCEYIQKLEAESGIKAWFVYDTGWNKIVGARADFYLLAALMIVFSGCFARDYSAKSSSGGFAQILRATKRGRRRTFVSKMLSSATVAALLSVLFSALEAGIILGNYDTPAGNAPLLSIERFGATASGLTIVEYVIIMYILRMIAAVLLVLFICALSQITKRELNTMSITAAAALLPALVAYFGLPVAGKINFLDLFSATPLFVAGQVLPFVLVTVLIVTLCIYFAGKSFVKGGSR